TVVNPPAMISLPSGCKATALTPPFAPEPGSKLLSKLPSALRRAMLVRRPPLTVENPRCQPGGGDGLNRDIGYRVIGHQAGIRSPSNSGAEAGIDADIDSPQFHCDQADRAC